MLDPSRQRATERRPQCRRQKPESRNQNPESPPRPTSGRERGEGGRGASAPRRGEGRDRNRMPEALSPSLPRRRWVAAHAALGALGGAIIWVIDLLIGLLWVAPVHA